MGCLILVKKKRKRMVNEKGRPKKYENRERTHLSFILPMPFKETAKKLRELSNMDNDPSFKAYCLEIEQIDLSKRKQGREGVYIRWIIYKHVFENIAKLNLKDGEGKNKPAS